MSDEPETDEPKPEQVTEDTEVETTVPEEAVPEEAVPEETTTEGEEHKTGGQEEKGEEAQVPTAEDSLKESFLYNDMLVRALVQLFPQKERTFVHMWLEKLRTVKGDEQTMSRRNDYACLLLLVLRRGTLTEPFNDFPPSDDLPPVTNIIHPGLFEEMFTPSSGSHNWMDGMIPPSNEKGEDVPPSRFLDYQPRPVNGASCYFSVFSRQP